jgi:hypothetical protein
MSIRPLLTAALFAVAACTDAAAQPFAIHVVDEATGRGVPLVELKTTNSIVYVTDSSGLAAIDEPGLIGTRVHFSVSSHGYEFPKDGFGFRGKALEVTPGGEATLKIKRLNIAERLYRVTGQGIYADTARLGREPPIAEPVINGLVLGQDSVQTAIYKGTLRWFWGDTTQAAYPLGNFGTSAAVSDLPGQGGLAPSVGVNLRYLVDEKGFSRPMFKLGKPGPVWVDAMTTLADPDGNERLVCHYSRMKDLGHREEHGLAVFDDEHEQFAPIVAFPDDARLCPQGQDFRVTEENGDEYLYFATAYPLIRVRAQWHDFLDPERYEAYSPLVEGSGLDLKSPALDRGQDGKLICGWKRNTALVGPQDLRTLITKGLILPDECRPWTVDAATGQPVQVHAGSVHWNEYRRRYVMIASQVFGTSMLGEIYYLEAPRPEGPWSKGVKIVTHEKYSFYNPMHHPHFDEDGGRVIYFEGTYTHTFSGNVHPTPRYDYNQVMYRLDLADGRLKGAQ